MGVKSYKKTIQGGKNQQKKYRGVKLGITVRGGGKISILVQGEDFGTREGTNMSSTIFNIISIPNWGVATLFNGTAPLIKVIEKAFKKESTF